MALSNRRPTLRSRLGLERLELRDTPATLSLSGGSLTISNNKAAILVNQLAVGTFQVFDGAINHGTYSIGNNLTINTLHANDTITVNLFSGKYLPGSLTINSFNGNDQITVTGSGSGRIGGALVVNASNGNDAINLGRTAGGIDSGIRVGSISTIAGGAGIDSLTIGGLLAGNTFNFTQVNNFSLGKGGAIAQINGNVTFDNTFDYGAPNTITFEASSIIAGNLKYYGGTGDDNVTVAGTACTVANRSALVDAGQGNSTLSLTGQVGIFVFSNFTFKGANNPLTGSDSVSISDTAVVSNNLTLLMGEGANFFDLAHNFFVGGNFTLSAGSDADDVGAIDAIINGNANVSTGSGDDTIRLGTFGSGLGFIGGNLSVDVGDGDDSVELNVNVGSGPGSGQVYVNLAAGNDIFNACDPLYSAYGAATIDLGLDADFDQTMVLFASLAPFTTYLNKSGGDVTATC